MCVHEEASVKPVVPPCSWKVKMANINSEAILASPSYVCGRERNLHTRARFPRLALPRRARARVLAHNMYVNGPPKSNPSPCKGVASFCCFKFLVT